MNPEQMPKTFSSRVRTLLIAFSALAFAILACTNELREPVDHTLLNSQDLSGIDLSWKAMYRIDFSGKNLRGIIMIGAQIEEANFTNADLRDADLTDAIANNAIFDGADLRGAKMDRLCFRGSSWEGAKLDPHWLEVITVLDKMLIPNQDLHEMDLSGLCMYSYDLRYTNLYKADLSESNLAWADFTGANLQEANLADAHIGNTGFIKANLNGAIMTVEQLERAILCETIMPDGQISNTGCHLLPSSP